MSKYVSAWANYDGGYVIFGVKDPQPGHPLTIDGGILSQLSQSCLTGLTMLSLILLIHRLRSYQPG